MLAQADVAPKESAVLSPHLWQIPVLVLSLPLSHPDVQAG